MIVIFLSHLIGWYLSIDTYVRHHHNTKDTDNIHIYHARNLNKIVVSFVLEYQVTSSELSLTCK
jgi:hypothetical protein